MASDSVAERTQLAIQVQEGLVKLGPTFHGIGQQLSTRVDVLSLEFVKELEKLQVGNSECSLSPARLLHQWAQCLLGKVIVQCGA